jgi:RNA polymerase sigma factor (TIGR02999 family)
MPLVYRDLKRRAGAYLRRERHDHTLQPTALVHEAYLRLIGQDRSDWQNRAQFFGIASQMMRRILVDHARERHATKRPGAGLRVTLDDRIGAVVPRGCELLALDDALNELEKTAPRQAQIVEMRYFGGLSETEVGAVLDLSRATVTREWQQARGWLYRRITNKP